MPGIQALLAALHEARKSGAGAAPMAPRWSAGRRRALRHWARAPRKRQVRVTGLCRRRAAGSVIARQGCSPSTRRSIPRYAGRGKRDRRPDAFSKNTGSGALANPVIPGRPKGEPGIHNHRGCDHGKTGVMDSRFRGNDRKGGWLKEMEEVRAPRRYKSMRFC
jgi:hypothetical protein